MGSIRKQSIVASFFIYLGFLVGMVNTYFFVRKGYFTPDQYAVTRIFFDIGQMVFAFSSLGVCSILYKFSPYYKDRLSIKENDLLTWCLVAVTIGFLLVVASAYIFEPLVIRKFSERSLLFVVYYRWAFIFGMGYLFFSVLEAYTYTLHIAILPNLLRELGLRLLTTLLIIPYCLQWISFDGFIKLFSLLYLAIAISLLVYLVQKNKFHLVFTVSRVTVKFRKKIFALFSLTYAGALIQIIAISIDSLIIASLKGLTQTGIYSLALYIANIVQIPQRSVQTVTTPVLSQAWKDKNMELINRIYHRTSLNLLIVSCLLFGFIWLNTIDALHVFKVGSEYMGGLMVILILGLARIIDAGTGVNAQIIGTSVFWRFEFLSGVVLLSLRIPLNYILIKEHGITGSAIADLISLIVYNLIRMIFLWKKFRMQPFTMQTLLALIFAVGAYFLVEWSCHTLHGWTAIAIRCIFFGALYGGLVYAFKLTPDAEQLLQVALNKVPWIKKKPQQ